MGKLMPQVQELLGPALKQHGFAPDDLMSVGLQLQARTPAALPAPARCRLPRPVPT